MSNILAEERTNVCVDVLIRAFSSFSINQQISWFLIETRSFITLLDDEKRKEKEKEK